MQPGPQRPSALAVFRRRSFALLWTAQSVSTTGSALTTVAASLLVYRLTGSALSVGLLLMAAALPSLLFGLIAGVFVDRWDRRRTMMAADLSRAVLVGAVPLLLPFSLWWLFAVVVVSNALRQFYEPAHASLLPETAPEDELAAANAFMAVSAYGFNALGYAAAGLIAAHLPLTWVFSLDALSFVLSAVGVGAIRSAPLAVEERATTVRTVLRSLRAGVRYVGETPILRSLFLVYLPVFAVVGYINTLLLPLTLRAFKGTDADYGLLAGIEVVGFIGGGLVMAHLADRLHEGQWLVLSFLGMGLAGGALAQAGAVPPAAGLIALLGLANAPSIVARQLAIQRHTPREVRGRVNSAFLVTRNLAVLLGTAAAGLADRCDVRELYLFGRLVLLCSAGLALALPGLRQPVAAWRRALLPRWTVPDSRALWRIRWLRTGPAANVAPSEEAALG
jgi:MFS family permease